MTKKLISLFAAVAMVVTSFATTAMARTGEEKISLEVEKINFSESKYEAYKDFDYGMDAYMVTAYGTGFELKTTLGTGMNKTKASGTSISSIMINLYVESTGAAGINFAVESVYPAVETDAGWTMKDFITDDDGKLVKPNTYGSGSGMIYPAAGVAAEATKTDKVVLYKAIVNTDGTPVKISIKNSEVVVNNFTNNSKSSMEFDYVSNLGSLTNDPTVINVPVSEVTKHTVTFKNGEDVVSTAEVEEGADIVKPSDPDKLGYVFKGWFTKENGEGDQFVEGTKMGTADVTYYAYFVKLPVPVSAISLTADKTTLEIGETANITVVYDPETAETGKDIASWETSAPAVATVEDGVVKAIGAGKATITAKTVAGITGTIEITVNKAPDPENVITIGDPFKGTKNKGFVWTVKIENLTKSGLGYKFESAGVDPKEGDFDMTGVELNGTFNFDVILNTDKPEVSLDVVAK